MPERASDLWWLFTRQTVCVTREENLLDAAQLMYNRNFRHLPIVTQGSKIVGIVSAQDIIDSLHLAMRSSSSPEQIKESLSIPVEKVMSPGIIAVEPGDGLAQIVKKMIYHNIGALPVVNEQGVIQGIITLRDLIALIGTSSNPLSVLVSEVMNTNVTTINLEDSFTKVVQLMSEHRVRRLPILGKNNMGSMGVITNKDVLHYILEATERKKLDGNNNRFRGFSVPISELMTKEVLTISQNDDVRVAASRMMIFGVGGLVVDDITTGVIGLVTERDLVRQISRIKSVEFLVEAMRYESETAPNPKNQIIKSSNN